MKSFKKYFLVLSFIFLLTANSFSKPVLKLTIFPKDGEKDVSPAASIYLNFNRSVKVLKVSVQDKSGKTISGDLVFTEKSRNAIFDPFSSAGPFSIDKRLLPETEYTVTVNADDNEFTSHFTTSSLGKPLKDEENLKGKKYLLNSESGLLIKPAQLMQIAKQQGQKFSIPEILITVEDYQKAKKGSFFKKKSSSTIKLIFEYIGDKKEVAGKEGNLKIKFAKVNFNNPFFSTKHDSITLNIMDKELIVNQLFFGGVVSEDGKSVGDIELSGILDIRDMLKAMDMDMEPENAKQMIENLLGEKLVNCKDKKQYCLELRFIDIKASEYKGEK